jgi:hypothetical protein
MPSERLQLIAYIAAIRAQGIRIGKALNSGPRASFELQLVPGPDVSATFLALRPATRDAIMGAVRLAARRARNRLAKVERKRLKAANISTAEVKALALAFPALSSASQAIVDRVLQQ